MATTKTSNPPQLRLRIFAGPNGSGKSTIINNIRQETVNGRLIDFGCYINADDIATDLRSGMYSFDSFDITVTKPLILGFAEASGLLNDKLSPELVKSVISARDYKNNAYFRFYMDSIHLGPGTLSYSGPGRGKLNVIYENYHTDKSVFVTSAGAPGEFKITKFDTTTGILAGTFWFDAIDTVTNRKVEIRDGRFDLYVDG